MAKLLCRLQFNRGAEVGVEKGKYSEILCRANPKLKLYCIDPWTDYSDYKERRADRHGRYYKEARKRLGKYNCEIVKKYSIDAVRDFKPDSLDFVYIDANHALEYVLEDITEWSKIVRKDGIVAGHDYMDNKNMHPGVTKAVDFYIKKHNKKLFLLRKKYNPRSKFGDTSWFFIN